MTILKEAEDLFKITEAGAILKDIFIWLNDAIREGVSTKDLDRQVEEYIVSKNAKPAFKGYRGYPSTICASVNDVVVHGIPSSKIILKNGDIIGIDAGLVKNDFFVDGARTFFVGSVGEAAGKLMEAANSCLEEGTNQAVAGNRVSDISYAIQTTAKKNGYEEVRAFVGHGIGRNLHEDPEIPNWVSGGKDPKLKEGQVIAIEPMINAGTRRIKVLSDGWTAVTEDGALSAHFENTIIVGKKNAKVIT